ncbi:MAG: endonuclease domain-containing protein [Alphaproteobacteria bacterium]|nr:MAG: endonuclease domain-containing protein [Alphaproteobacteria bacterium]
MAGNLVDRARGLRRAMTDAERCFWHHVRARRFHGLKFRRQFPVGHFIVDFACPARRLIVEIDGGQHADPESGDALRTAHLESRGFRVVRYWNNDILGNIDGVMTDLEAHLGQQPPHPNPLPAGERG